MLLIFWNNEQMGRKDASLKWHVLTAMRYMMLGQLPLTARPEGLEKACKQLLKVIWQPPKECVQVFLDAVKIVKSVPRISEQDLRTKSFTDKLIPAAIAYHSKNTKKK